MSVGLNREVSAAGQMDKIFQLMQGVQFEQKRHQKRYWESPSNFAATHLAFTCSKLTMETLEQGVKYV